MSLLEKKWPNSQRPQKRNWTWDETKCLLDKMIINMNDKPYDKKLFKSREMLLKLERQLQAQGIRRDSYQIAIKIKNMRKVFFTAISTPPDQYHKREDFMEEMREVFDPLYEYPGINRQDDPLEFKKEEDIDDSSDHGDPFENTEMTSFDDTAEDQDKPISAAADSFPESTAPGSSKFQSADSGSRKRKRRDEPSDLILATKMLIDAQRQLFEEQARRDQEEAEKDRELLRSLLNKLSK
ncbi:uncharacterized protein LOC129800339 [Phlebotomus papatasi]|uniref:uncharacterized protein LOC129800339 n=1 Tax=Phlebotomus papatasi TaxID=29031 RepID=UPI002484154B|nr:uncharacterized protein LOC129800339 [Phlebotomus papatasi]